MRDVRHTLYMRRRMQESTDREQVPESLLHPFCATPRNVGSVVARCSREGGLTMRIGEMTDEECKRMLTHTSIGRLGCSREDQPYIVPIYYVHEPEHLYGFSTEGQKIEWMRANPKVCVEIDEITNHYQWSSVVLYGRYRELPDLPQYAEGGVHHR